MKLMIDRKKANIAGNEIMRKAGYGYIVDRKTGHDSYVRRMTRDFYPRFHMYIEETKDILTLNLHLDQKQASYENAHMHNAEYEGELVESEIERIKDVVRSMLI